jgi:N-acetylglutamate synthase-like GNAT family acetyltransferase
MLPGDKSMSLSIREAQDKDIGELRRLMEELGSHAMSPTQMMNRLQFVRKSQFDSLYVCEDGDNILGLLGFRIRENLEEASRFGEVSAIVVYPDGRRRGVGRFMMDYAEKLAKDLECKGMWLVSGFAREEEAHKFYKELGYNITGYRFVKLFK